jgi:glucose/mannose-6-phosphate isomerase
MSPAVDESVLDAVDRLARLDPQEMLAAVATGGPQLREHTERAAEELAGLDRADRPRAVLVAGMGGSAIAGDVLAAGTAGSPVPVLVHREATLPGWVGAADLVVAVSCSGRTEETLSAAVEADRRGARLVGVGAAGSPLAELTAAAGGTFATVRQRLAPRASLWGLTGPLAVLADRLGLVELPAGTIEATAARLDQVAAACRPDRESFVNPAKELALQLAGSLPVIWGSTAAAGVAARRLASQLAENAKYPAMSGALPEADHNQVVAFDGPYAVEDLFHDRESEPPPRLRLVLLRDPAEDDRSRRRADATRAVAAGRGVRLSELVADGESWLERLASLIALGDHASVYLAALLGVDPTPIAPIVEIKSALG